MEFYIDPGVYHGEALCYRQVKETIDVKSLAMFLAYKVGTQ